MIRCLLLGHDPRGPVRDLDPRYVFTSPPYRCANCKRLIVFKKRGGWRLL